MQTFLPLPDLHESAAVLDRLRLGKQRVETLQLVQTILGRKVVTLTEDGYDLPQEEWYTIPVLRVGWSYHPAAIMWSGSVGGLLAYQEAVVSEWTGRGYADTCLDKTRFLLQDVTDRSLPSWFGDPEFHRAHRSNLIRKDPEWYGPLWPDVPDDLEYIWPGSTDYR